VRPFRWTTARPPLDWTGIVVVSLALGALVLGITRVAECNTVGFALWPWLLVLLPLSWHFARRAALPMIDPRALSASGLTPLRVKQRLPPSDVSDSCGGERSRPFE
jgi:hypothetical protein